MPFADYAFNKAHSAGYGVLSCGSVTNFPTGNTAPIDAPPPVDEPAPEPAPAA